MNKNKSRNKRNRQTIELNAPEMTRRRFLAGAIGAAGLAAGLGVYALFKPVDNYEGIPGQYIERFKRYGNAPSNRDIYFLFQVHDFEGHNLKSYLGEKTAKELSKSAAESTSKAQVSIYRILESLCNQAKVDLVTVEGRSRKDINSSPGRLLRKIPELKHSLESDEFLSEKIRKDSTFAGAEWATAVFDNLYLSGFEDPNHLRPAMALTDALHYQTLIKTLSETCKEFPPELIVKEIKNWGFNEQQLEKIKAQLEELKNNPQEAERFAQEFARMEQEFEKTITQRSLDALANSIQTANTLYLARKIRNKNIAIVIGARHQKDYEEMVKRDKRGESNFVFIHPKGLAEAQK